MAALVDSDRELGFQEPVGPETTVTWSLRALPHTVEIRVFLAGLESLSQKFCCDWPALSSFREAVGSCEGRDCCCCSVAQSYPTLQG